MLKVGITNLLHWDLYAPKPIEIRATVVLKHATKWLAALLDSEIILLLFHNGF